MSDNLLIFEDCKVEIELIDNVPYFETYTTGMALGYITHAKGKVYAYKERIDKIVKNAEISTVSHGVKQFFTESQLYDFMLEAKTDKCKKFRKWVTNEVLPQIRKTGGYIPVDEKDTEFEILAKAVLIGQRTMEEQKRLIEEQNIKINDLLPKAQSYDQLINSKGLFSMGEVAQSIGLFGRTKFMKVLRNMGILQATTCRPYQPFVDKKYFMVKDCVLPNGENAVVTKVTPKGVDYIVKRFKKSGLLPSVNQEVII